MAAGSGHIRAAPAVMISLGLGTSAPVATRETGFTAPDLRELALRLEVIFGNRYEVLRPVGAGGMSSVFQLRHRLHRGLFAVKVLHAQLAEEPEFLARFRTEAIHAASLSGHPNIASILDLGEADGLFYIVMPFIQGEDLDHILGRLKRIDRREALRAAAQIGSALMYAESRGVLHCDLTPGNIRLNTFGLYQVFDFGLSRAIGPGHRADRTTRAGTPLYMSPEQIEGGSLDIRSDLYSLGAILFEMLAGHPPYCAETLREVEEKHLAGDLLLPQELDGDVELAALLRRSLARTKEDRVQSPAELEDLLSGMGVQWQRSAIDPIPAFAELSEAPRRRLMAAGEEPCISP